MIIQTKYVGKIEVNETNIVQFPTGLPGFPDQVEFALLDIPGNAMFQTLQSTTTHELAFIVTNPYHFYKEYEFQLDDTVLEILQIKKEQEVVVLAIVTLKDPFKTSTLNLKAPLIINSTKKVAKQYVLNMDDYPAKASIVPSTSLKVKGD